MDSENKEHLDSSGKKMESSRLRLRPQIESELEVEPKAMRNGSSNNIGADGAIEANDLKLGSE